MSTMSNIQRENADALGRPATAGYTPGPWVSDGLKVEGDAQTHMHDIALVECLRVFDAGCEEAKANARLIAAAPELYEALEALFHGPCSTFDTKWLPEMHAARAALRKARGEAV